MYYQYLGAEKVAEFGDYILVFIFIIIFGLYYKHGNYSNKRK
jgi:hypothetical protein